MHSPERDMRTFAADIDRGGSRSLSGKARILCVLTHPTQYDPPVWRYVCARGIEEFQQLVRRLPEAHPSSQCGELLPDHGLGADSRDGVES
jgi:hypothetical protein